MKLKPLLFSLIAIGGVLALTEIVLLVAGIAPLAKREDPFHGFSKSVRIFETDAQAGVIRTRERAARHSFNVQEFALDKPGDALRLFVLGGSSAYGFPWGAKQAFPAALERALQASFPDRPVQVINAAGMSYGSHRVRILTHELLDYEPDVLVFYSGHNEFVERDFYDRVQAEPLPGGLRAVLHRWRLYSALSRLLAPAGQPLETDPGATDTSAAELIGLDAEREYATDVAAADREAVRAQFEENLRAMVHAADEAGVAVVLCTMPSNLRGWRPNQTAWPGELSAADRAAATQAIERAVEANENGDPEAALRVIGELESHTTTAAGAWYEKGRALLALERAGEAAEAFVAARDYDGQPGRAPGLLNTTIREVAKSTGATLVDVEAVFEQQARNGIPGFDLFEDYVHPKPAAHLLIAREVWRAMLENGVAVERRSADAAAFLAMLELPADFDYTSSVDAPDAAESAQTSTLLFNLAVVLENQGRYDEAMDRYRRCLERNPAYIVARVNLARLLRLTGDPMQAAEQYSQVLSVWPQHLNSAIGLGESFRELGLLREAEASFRRATDIDAEAPGAWNGLGAVYTLTGNHGEAERAFRRTVALDPGNLPVRTNLGMAIFFQGRLDEAETEFRAMLDVRADDPGGMNGLGAIAVERNDLATARDWFTRVLAVEPQNALARDGLAEVQRRGG